MGIDLAWLSVEGGDRSEFLERLGLEEAGETNNEFGAQYALAETSNGWLILTTKDSERAFEKALATISAHRLAIACEMSETVMVSRARAVRDGRQLWSVTHDPEVDLNGLQVEGEPPAELSEIRARLETQQASDDETDYLFEAPVELAATICGYRPDQGPARAWTILRRKSARKPKGEARPKSLRATIRAELVPLVLSLGWKADTVSQKIPGSEAPEFLFEREHGGFTQRLWFDYESGKKPFLSVGHAVGSRALDNHSLIQGHFWERERFLPWWTRFFNGLKRPRPTPAQIIDELIEQVREDVRLLDDFLRGGEWPHRLALYGPAAETWPALPPDIRSAPPAFRKPRKIP